MDTHPIIQILLGTSLLVVIGISAYLAFTVHQLLPPPPNYLNAIRAVGCTSFGVAVGYCVFFLAAEGIYSYYKACRNKENL